MTPSSTKHSPVNRLTLVLAVLALAALAFGLAGCDSGSGTTDPAGGTARSVTVTGIDASYIGGMIQVGVVVDRTPAAISQETVITGTSVTVALYSLGGGGLWTATDDTVARIGASITTDSDVTVDGSWASAAIGSGTITLAWADAETSDDNDTVDTYVGDWESFFGDLLSLRDDGTYEFGLAYFTGEITYKEKGTYTVSGANFTFVKTHEMDNDGLSTWLAADFDSKFERDRLEWNDYLETLSIDPVETDEEWWAANFDWAQSSLGGYAGYVTGMTLEQYKIAARNAYTETLTWETPWTLENDELTITCNGKEYNFDPVTAE